MKYTEEEKRAIDILNDFQFRSRTIVYNKIDSEDVGSVKIVLNLLEKQQKEIEEKDKLICFNRKYINELEQDLFENASNYVISKEKIKNKIKELENIEIDYDNLILQGDKILFAIRILEELIGIEPRKEFWKGYKQ